MNYIPAKFGDNVRTLLLKRIINKELDVSIKDLRFMKFYYFPNSTGELSFSFDSKIVDKLSAEINAEIKALWMSNHRVS